jgi:hypothetical protein
MEKIDEGARNDGIWILKTNTAWNAEEVGSPEVQRVVAARTSRPGMGGSKQ